MAGKFISRKDSKGYQLRRGECQRNDGRYVYAYTDRLGVRRSIYSKTLVGLREKERELQRGYEDGLDPHKAQQISVSDMVQKYIENKNNLKTTTKGMYVFVFKHYINNTFGKRKIVDIKYSDVLTYYFHMLKEDGLSGSIVDHVHGLLHPAFQMAVRDGLIRTNPTDGAMAEVKASKYFVVGKREALSAEQQKAFMDYLKSNREYTGWVPVVTVLLGTGMRIGECLGLTWNDLNFKERTISVNHTLTDRPDEHGHTQKRIETPKTKAGTRIIPMVDEVFDAFLDEYQIQKCLGFCEEEIDGYKDFVFSTASHTVYLASAVNHAIHRAADSYNEKEKHRAEYEEREPLLLPTFSAHNLRHTFCTRLCENDVNLKVIQTIMGHSDITTTMNIYADCHKEKKKEALDSLRGKLIL